MAIVVSDLSFAHPGDAELFCDVSFRVGAGPGRLLTGALPRTARVLTTI